MTGSVEQTLYEGIYDRPPAKVWGTGSHLCIAMPCALFDRCSRYVIAHRYDTQAKAFVALKSEKTARGIRRCGTLKIKEGGWGLFKSRRRQARRTGYPLCCLTVFPSGSGLYGAQRFMLRPHRLWPSGNPPCLAGLRLTSVARYTARGGSL